MKPDIPQEALTEIVGSLARLSEAEASLLILSGRGAVAHNLAAPTSLQRQLLQASSASEQPFLWEVPRGTRLDDGREAASAMATRIIANSGYLGAIVLLRPEGYEPFGRQDLNRLSAFAALLGPSLEVHTRVDSAIGLLGALGEACRATEIQDLLDRAIEGTARALGASGASVMLLDERGDLVIQAARGLPEKVVRGARRHLGEGIAGYVARNGEPLLLTGQVHDPRFQGIDPGINGAICVPLRGSRGILGVLNLRRKAVSAPFSPGELTLALGLAQGLAGVLERAREARQADDDRRQALALYELGRLARGSSEESEALATALEMAGDYLGATQGVVAEKVGEGRWKILASRGMEEAGDYEPRVLEQILREGRAVSVSIPESTGEGALRPKNGVIHLGVPLEAGGAVGALLLARDDGRPFGGQELGLIEALGIEIGALWEGLRRRQDQGSRVAAEERQRIAQELHDGLAQELSGVLLAIEGSQLALARDPEVARRQLEKAVKSARECLRDVRRYLTVLRSDEAEQGDTVSLLRRIAEEMRRHGLAVELRAEGKGPALHGEVQRTVLRVAQEALSNVQKHARARVVQMVVTQTEDTVGLRVEDDGVGFMVAETIGKASTQGRYGLLGMRERAESVGGRLEVGSEPGRGTRIQLIVPLMTGRELPLLLEEPDAKAESTTSGTMATTEASTLGNNEEETKSKSLLDKLPALLKR